jgi:hypothetical protein
MIYGAFFNQVKNPMPGQPDQLYLSTCFLFLPYILSSLLTISGFRKLFKVVFEKFVIQAWINLHVVQPAFTVFGFCLKERLQTIAGLHTVNPSCLKESKTAISTLKLLIKTHITK